MNIDSINVNKYPVSRILAADMKTVYEVPKYQREYTWRIQEWNALYDDIVENQEGYFLGSIICIKTPDTLDSKFEVVDGQQRLTTISIFLAALYDLLRECRKNGALNEDQDSDLRQLKYKLLLRNTNSTLRVVPQVQGHNREDYMGLISAVGIIEGVTMPAYAGVRRIVKAFNHFRRRITEDLLEEPNKVAALFGLLDKLNSALLVVIEVSNHADAYTLFESLNNRGMPLTSIDLIKNLLLAQLDRLHEGEIDEYFQRWSHIMENLGDDYGIQERFFRQNYNAFRSYLNEPFCKESDTVAYPLGAIVTRSNLLAVYEKLIKKDPLRFLNDISITSRIYSALTMNKCFELSADLRNSLLDLQRVQGAPAYLILLYLIKNKEDLKVNDDIIVRVVDFLVRFFIRRNITDTPPTRDLTRLFMACIEEMELGQYTGEVIVGKLREKLLPVSASDSTFAETLHGPVYAENAWATRFILCMLAKQGMTKENELDLWKQTDSKQYVWSIEHIFPQGDNIPECWVDMIAGGDGAKAKEYQNEYVHTLGNLTITGYNSTLGNKSFAVKRDRVNSSGAPIGYKNGLNLNEAVASKDKWTIDEIRARTDAMVEDVLKLFSLD